MPPKEVFYVYSAVQSCLTPCYMDWGLPGSSAHGIFQARILEWVAISSSRVSSRPRDWTHISCVSCFCMRILYLWATWEVPKRSQERFFLYKCYFRWFNNQIYMRQIYIIKAFDFVQKEVLHHEKFKDRKVEGSIYMLSWVTNGIGAWCFQG